MTKRVYILCNCCSGAVPATGGRSITEKGPTMGMGAIPAMICAMLVAADEPQTTEIRPVEPFVIHSQGVDSTPTKVKNPHVPGTNKAVLLVVAGGSAAAIIGLFWITRKPST